MSISFAHVHRSDDVQYARSCWHTCTADLVKSPTLLRPTSDSHTRADTISRDGMFLHSSFSADQSPPASLTTVPSYSWSNSHCQQFCWMLPLLPAGPGRPHSFLFATGCGIYQISLLLHTRKKQRYPLTWYQPTQSLHHSATVQALNEQYISRSAKNSSPPETVSAQHIAQSLVQPAGAADCTTTTALSCSLGQADPSRLPETPSVSKAVDQRCRCSEHIRRKSVTK